MLFSVNYGFITISYYLLSSSNDYATTLLHPPSCLRIGDDDRYCRPTSALRGDLGSLLKTPRRTAGLPRGLTLKSSTEGHDGER